MLHGANLSPGEGARLREHLQAEIARLLGGDGREAPDAPPAPTPIAGLREGQIAGAVAERVASTVQHLRRRG